MSEESNFFLDDIEEIHVDLMDVNEIVMELFAYWPDLHIRFWVNDSNYFTPEVKAELLKLEGSEFRAKVTSCVAYYVSYKKHNAKKMEDKN